MSLGIPSFAKKIDTFSILKQNHSLILASFVIYLCLGATFAIGSLVGALNCLLQIRYLFSFGTSYNISYLYKAFMRPMGLILGKIVYPAQKLYLPGVRGITSSLVNMLRHVDKNYSVYSLELDKPVSGLQMINVAEKEGLGARAPTVILHFGYNDAALPRHYGLVAALLDNDCRVVFYNPPQAACLNDLVQPMKDVVKLLKCKFTLDSKCITLYGHSMGGVIATKAASLLYLAEGNDCSLKLVVDRTPASIAKTMPEILIGPINTLLTIFGWNFDLSFDWELVPHSAKYFFVANYPQQNIQDERIPARASMDYLHGHKCSSCMQYIYDPSRKNQHDKPLAEMLFVNGSNIEQDFPVDKVISLVKHNF